MNLTITTLVKFAYTFYYKLFSVGIKMNLNQATIYFSSNSCILTA